MAAGEGVGVVGFKTGERRIEHFPTGYYDDIEASGRLMATEQLARQPLGAAPDDCRPELSGRRNAKPRPAAPVGNNEQGHEPSLQPDAALVSLLELRASADPFVPGKALRHGRVVQRYRSSDTVRRFRPLVRRRFSTIRPFLVDIRTRKP